MHFSFLSPLLLLTTAVNALSMRQEDIFSDWRAPGPSDFRGPCPMLNTLANHGFLRRDGREITRDVAIRALGTAINFEADFAETIWAQGLKTNPEPNATSWSLDGLGIHDLLEHDASLSRTDAYHGNHRLFNATIFAETKSYWPTPNITREQMSNAKLGRMLTSKLTNPTYRFTNDAEGFSIGEILSPFMVFGSREDVLARRDWVEFWFENERFPTELGWTTPTDPIGFDDLRKLDRLFRNSSSLITEAYDPNEAEPAPAVNATRHVRSVSGGGRLLLH